MRNLVKIRDIPFSASLKKSIDSGIAGFAASDNGTCFVVSKDAVFWAFDASTGKVTYEVDLRAFNESTGEPPLVPEDGEVVGLEYIAELETVCIAATSGEIITYQMNTSKTDCVGAIDSGFTAMSWSPDQELVVFTTGAETLVTMTKDFELLAEVSMLGVPMTEDAEPPAPTPADRRPVISWRADGKFFAVSSTDSTSGKRYVRVWERSSVLHSKSQEMPTLGLCMSWRPNGSIIACDEYIPQKDETNILFFEKNGLRHYEFQLCKGRANVMKLAWSNDSDILAVLVVLPGQTLPVIQFWYRSNYQWYLKHEARSLSSDASFSFARWDPNTPLRLHAASANGDHSLLDFTWEYPISRTSHTDPCLAAVINGSAALLTPLRHAVVPPPMSAAVAQVPSGGPINEVAFGPDASLLLVTSSGEMHGYKPTGKPAVPPFFGLPHTLSFSIPSAATSSMRLRQFVWPSANTIFAVDSARDNAEDSLVQLSITEGESPSAATLSVVGSVPIKGGKALRTHYHAPSSITFVLLDGGAVLSFDVSKGASSLSKWSQAFPTTCNSFAVTATNRKAGQSHTDKSCLAIVGLSPRGLLFLGGDNKLSSNCSSFALHDKFLLFTTHSHHLRLLPLSVTVQEMVRIAGSPPTSANDDSYRDIERGGVLVASVPSDIKVVLQMPRGNLEGFAPRALVLDAVCGALSNLDYKNAHAMARKRKIDLNLLYDHDPTTFLANARSFVSQISNVEHINVFLSTLRDEDVTQTVFRGYSEKYKATRVTQQPPVATSPLREVPAAGPSTQAQSTEASPAAADSNSKVNQVCLALRSAMEQEDTSRYLLSILTTYARCTPPDLENALLRIRQLREAHDHRAEEALDHIIFLADVNRLYDIALGMYDFDLVLMVAQKSQKDPKEYIPFLKKLQEMPMYEQRYAIDAYLGRWESALRNLFAGGPSENFDRCLSLARQHELYKVALSLYTRESHADHHATILEAYGDYLLVWHEPDQAAYVFLECQQLKKAQAAFKSAGLWQNVFALAGRIGGLTPADEKALGYEMAEALNEMGRGKEAALVLREYANDTEGAVTTLLGAHAWDEAVRMCYSARRADLIETNVIPAVREAHHSKMEHITENSAKFTKFVERLQTIRANKEAFNQLNIGTGGPGEDDAASAVDAFSDTSSVYSDFTLVSGSTQTGMSRVTLSKKDSKKKKIKKGSAHEEQHIFSALKHMTPTDSEKEEVGGLCRALIYFGQSDQARQLQAAFEAFCLQAASAPTPPPETESKRPPKASAGQDWKLNVLD